MAILIHQSATRKFVGWPTVIRKYMDFEIQESKHSNSFFLIRCLRDSFRQTLQAGVIFELIHVQNPICLPYLVPTNKGLQTDWVDPAVVSSKHPFAKFLHSLSIRRQCFSFKLGQRPFSCDVAIKLIFVRDASQETLWTEVRQSRVSLDIIEHGSAFTNSLHPKFLHHN